MTLDQLLSAAESLLIHVIPSELVITLFPVPVDATATNKPFPYVTLNQSLSGTEVLIDQFIPSELVITLLPDP